MTGLGYGSFNFSARAYSAEDEDFGVASGSFHFAGTALDATESVGTGAGWYDFDYKPSQGMQIIYPSTTSYYERFRFIVEDAHGKILARDVTGLEPRITKALSGPSNIEFKIHYNDPSIQQPDGTGAIQLKPYGHLIHAEKEFLDGSRRIIASGIMQPSDVDPASGVLSLKAQGFSAYAQGLPWLVDWDPWAVDPFEIVERIWDHIQSYPNGNLGVTVYPTDSGTYMLPGFSFNSEKFIMSFFAIFIRQSDRNDCGDYINKLARDIPFDYVEESGWNDSYSSIWKRIHLGYPSAGVIQDGLIFRPNENIKEMKAKVESEIEWASDICIQGWFPTQEYSSEFINADPDRFRRVLQEGDYNINSTERAAAWAHRQLTRRQVPRYFESITIDPYHSHAPFGTFDVGDTIRIQGTMPWVGMQDLQHRITGWGFDEAKGSMELTLKVDGAFSYDPIAFIPPGRTVPL